MDIRLPILAATQALIVVATSTVAHAENKKDLARTLFELGIEEYKTREYEAAAMSMAKSYSLDPQPSALYALAQAERLNNDCKSATEHYQKLLETSNDESIKVAVKTNLELCAQIARGEKVKEGDASTLLKRDAPTLTIKTIYRTQKTNDKLTIVMFVGGGVALSSSLALYLVGRSARSDADHATTLAEYNDRFDRAHSMRLWSYAAAGVGVTLVGLATYRLLRGNKEEESSPVAIVPLRDGSMISWAGSF